MPATVNERQRGVLLDEADGSHIHHAQYNNQKDKDVVTNKSGAALEPADVVVYGGATDQGVTVNTTASALQPALVVPNEVDADDVAATGISYADGDQHWAYTGATIVPAAEIDAAWSRFEYLVLSATADKLHPTGITIGNGVTPPIGTQGFALDTGGAAGSGRVVLFSHPTYMPKIALAQTTAPGVTNDVDEGYTPGSLWIDTTNNNAYVCLDNTDGAAVWKSLTGVKRAVYTHQAAAATDGGGTTSGSWQTGPLTTELSDPDGIGTLASNQVTLAAGTYYVRGWRMLFDSAGTAYLKVRVRDVTNNVTLVVGEGQFASAAEYSLSFSGRFTLSGTAAIELQYYVTTTVATVGLGHAVNRGEVELYASMEIVQEA